jgi:hypothetical protein
MIVDVTGVRQPPTRGAQLRIDNIGVGLQRVTVAGKVNGLDAFWEVVVDVAPGNVTTAVAKRR